MPRTLNVQTYEDPIVVADLVYALKREGIPHRGSYSHVLHLIMEGTRKAWEMEQFHTTEEALQFLQNEGFSVAQMKDSTRGPRLKRAMNLEQAAAEHAVLELASNPGRAQEILALLHQKQDETDKETRE